MTKKPTDKRTLVETFAFDDSVEVEFTSIATSFDEIALDKSRPADHIVFNTYT